MKIMIEYVRENFQPMGGVLCLMTGDPEQLNPPDGSQISLSLSFPTNYDFIIPQTYESPNLERYKMFLKKRTALTLQSQAVLMA